MKILIISATELEIRPFLESGLQNNNNIEVLITGVGMVATAYALSKKIKNTHYDLLLNVGIAGGFHRETPLGTVTRVYKDVFSELGAQDHDQFLSLQEMGLGAVTFHEALPSFPSTSLSELIEQTPLASGITVNTVHGNDDSIQKVKEQYSPGIESMEGAAVFYVAKLEGIPVLQIRSLSNYVEKRNQRNWKIPLAVNNLNDWLILFISESLKSNPL